MTKTQQVIFQKYCDEPERRGTKRIPGDDSRGIEEGAKRIAHTTQSDRQKRSGKNSERRYCERSGSGEEFQTNREKGAHGTGQERAEHAVKCGLMHGKRISKRRPVTELYVNGSSTEDRGAWEK